MVFLDQSDVIRHQIVKKLSMHIKSHKILCNENIE